VSNDYEFTNNWFAHAPEVWEHLIPMLPGTPGERSFLEIGSYEGRSAIWIAENMMRGDDSLFCVDTWKGGEEHSQEDMDAVRQRFVRNMEKLGNRKNLYWHYAQETSVMALGEMLQESYVFEFIYIDGSHQAKDVLTDACMAWQVLSPGGIMVFDDYVWGQPRDILHRPKLAIDAFVNIFAEDLTVLHVGNQLVVKRNEG
jgi:predicted O-methyltransferase YrrM